MELKEKQLQDRAIKIKGKSYILVSDRIQFFNDEYTNGMISTELVSHEGGVMIMKATVYPDVMEQPDRYFTGYSQASYSDNNMVNKTSALENAETSAVGRALAMMGIGIIDSIASVDEMHKAGVSENTGDVMRDYTNRVANGTEEAKCKKCDAKMVVSKSTGKLYCSKFCWKNVENIPMEYEGEQNFN